MHLSRRDSFGMRINWPGSSCQQRPKGQGPTHLTLSVGIPPETHRREEYQREDQTLRDDEQRIRAELLVRIQVGELHRRRCEDRSNRAAMAKSRAAREDDEGCGKGFCLQPQGPGLPLEALFHRLAPSRDSMIVEIVPLKTDIVSSSPFASQKKF